VVALDNLKRRGSELTLRRLREHGVEFVHGDIRSPADLDSVGATELVVECSAEPSALAGYGESPRYVLDTNLGGTINCLEYARKHGSGFIFLSSSRVYPIAPLCGLAVRETETRLELLDEQPLPGAGAAGISEDFTLTGRRTLYGATKLASELILQEYIGMYGLRGVVNRCGVLTGPWQMGKVDQGVVVLWAAKHFYEKHLTYIGYGGTGKQVRDLLHIDDLLDLVLHQIRHLRELNGRTFNVGGGREVSVSLLELTELCAKLTGHRVPIGSDPETREGDVPIYITDTTAVRDACGWRPQRSVEAIMTDVVEWIAANRDMLEPVLA
jgi:CDP-paratose 2-epimerase